MNKYKCVKCGILSKHKVVRCVICSGEEFKRFFDDTDNTATMMLNYRVRDLLKSYELDNEALKKVNNLIVDLIFEREVSRKESNKTEL